MLWMYSTYSILANKTSGGACGNIEALCFFKVNFIYVFIFIATIGL